MREMERKLCKDCVHYKAAEARTFDLCLSPENSTEDLVRGNHAFKAQGCFDARTNEDYCGPDAKWFEPASEIEQLKQAV